MSNSNVRAASYVPSAQSNKKVGHCNACNGYDHHYDHGYSYGNNYDHGYGRNYDHGYDHHDHCDFKCKKQYIDPCCGVVCEPPVSKVDYVREIIATNTCPEIVCQEVDCCGNPVKLVQKISRVVTTTPWRLEDTCDLDASHAVLVPQIFRSA